MTNFNERVDEILCRFAVDTHDSKPGQDETPNFDRAKQALTSLTKELVAEAKPYRETIIDKWNRDRVDEVKATNAAMNAWADIYEQNLLKALEEV